jgi:DNA/RNA-binding domain of Phe-tRNA-synthetase-like protein
MFRYDSAIIENFPNIYGGVIVAHDLKNGPTPPDLLEAYMSEQQAALERIGDTPLSELESISAWRSVFSAFGVKPTKYRNAAESLLRRLTKKGDIPSINMLVDMGNLVSIRYGLPVAFCDTRQITGVVTVQFADGDEHFEDLGSSDTIHPDPGEVILADENDMVVARRWCWRQSATSATREDTTDVLVTIEGHHNTANEDVQAALNDLTAVLEKYTTGSYEARLLSKDQPDFDSRTV